jgi:hypothetical protein
MASAHRSRWGHFYASASYQQIPRGSKETNIGAAVATDGRPAINFCCSQERLSGAVISTRPFVGEGLASRSPGFDAPKLGLLMPGCVRRAGRFDLQQRSLGRKLSAHPLGRNCWIEDRGSAVNESITAEREHRGKQQSD